VVAFNSESSVEALLSSLNPVGEYIAQLVLVDNGSVDGTIGAVEALRGSLNFEVTVVRSENTGFAGGYLTAAGYVLDASLPTLCINPDVILHATALPGLLEAVHTWESIGIATAPLVGDDGVEDSASRRTLPSTGKSIGYAVFGKLMPRRMRYNSGLPRRSTGARPLSDGTLVTSLDATTGALMLVSPLFRSPSSGIFDTDYWMYGEDLQLCLDARSESFEVVMVELSQSIHLKGVSSGWPRSRLSNKAFHDAMYLYYRKNLSKSPLESATVWAGVRGRQVALQYAGSLTRALRARRRTTHARPASYRVE